MWFQKFNSGNMNLRMNKIGDDYAVLTINNFKPLLSKIHGKMSGNVSVIWCKLCFSFTPLKGNVKLRKSSTSEFFMSLKSNKNLGDLKSV